jgi:hypothetical protein
MGSEWLEPIYQRWPTQLDSIASELKNELPSRNVHNSDDRGKAWGFWDRDEDQFDAFKLYLDPDFTDQRRNGPSYAEALKYFEDYLKSLHEHLEQHLSRTTRQWETRKIAYLFAVPSQWRNAGINKSIEREFGSAENKYGHVESQSKINIVSRSTGSHAPFSPPTPVVPDESSMFDLAFRSARDVQVSDFPRSRQIPLRTQMDSSEMRYKDVRDHFVPENGISREVLDENLATFFGLGARIQSKIQLGKGGEVVWFVGGSRVTKAIIEDLRRETQRHYQRVGMIGTTKQQAMVINSLNVTNIPEKLGKTEANLGRHPQQYRTARKELFGPDAANVRKGELVTTALSRLGNEFATIPIVALEKCRLLIECNIAVSGIEEDAGSLSLSWKDVESRKIAGARRCIDRLLESPNDQHSSHVTPEFDCISGNRHLWDGECFDEAASSAKRHDGTGLGPYSKEPRLGPDDDDDDDDGCYGFCRSGMPTYDANYNAAAHLRRAHFNTYKNKRGCCSNKNGNATSGMPDDCTMAIWRDAITRTCIDPDSSRATSQAEISACGDHPAMQLSGVDTTIPA